MATNELHCAQCQQSTSGDAPRCAACGEDPRLDGRYRLLRLLGRGAFGTTWLAERIEDGLQVAVKELLVRSLDSFKAYDLFNREAELLRSLRHGSIPRYHDHFQVGQGRQLGLYLVTEFIDGQTLADELKETRYGPRDVLGILRELLDVVAWLHELTPSVIHRDIKPANVMRRRGDGSLVLIDFGAVKDVAREADGGGSTVAGTFGYMAPEQFAGRASPASDLYALGVLGLELATRQGPQAYLDDTNVLQWQAHVRDPGLRGILGQLIVADARARASDARAVARRVDEVLAGRLAAVEVEATREAGVTPGQANLVARALEAFRAANGVDLAGDAMAMARIRQACALAEAELREAPYAELNLPFLSVGPAGPLHLAQRVTRDDLAAPPVASPPTAPPPGLNARWQQLLAGHVSANDLLAAREGVTPGRASAPPEAPRPLPAGFGRRVEPRGHVLRLRGVSLVAWPLALLLAMRLVSGSFALAPALALGLALLVGLVMGVLGHTRVKSRARLWQGGVAVPAVVTDVDLSNGPRSRRRNAWRVQYRYERPDGVVEHGEQLSFEVPAEYRMRGAGIWAIYDPARPSDSVAWWD